MGTVRDPDFWRRFSRAVHQDEEAQAQKEQRPGIKHSYVSPSASRSSPSTSPTSISPLNPDMSTIANTPQPFSPSSIADFKESMTPMSPSTPTSTRKPRAPARQPSVLRKPDPNTLPSPTPRKPAPTHPHPFTSHRNTSQLTLGFSGRPPSRFKFWTQISSDPSNRDSWLESQRKKKRQRTWICWVFWLSLAGLITGIVVCVLLLKARKII